MDERLGTQIPIQRKCPICGEPALMMIGGPSLCKKHLDEQLPIVEAFSKELKQLIIKYKNQNLYETYMWRSFDFLSHSTHSIYNDPEFYKEWAGILLTNEQEEL